MLHPQYKSLLSKEEWDSILDKGEYDPTLLEKAIRDVALETAHWLIEATHFPRTGYSEEDRDELDKMIKNITRKQNQKLKGLTHRLLYGRRQKNPFGMSIR